jgi:hypothetical protein
MLKRFWAKVWFAKRYIFGVCAARHRAKAPTKRGDTASIDAEMNVRSSDDSMQFHHPIDKQCSSISSLS